MFCVLRTQCSESMGTYMVAALTKIDTRWYPHVRYALGVETERSTQSTWGLRYQLRAYGGGGVCSSVVRRRYWHELRRKVLCDATNNKRRIDGEGGVFHLQRCVSCGGWGKHSKKIAILPTFSFSNFYPKVFEGFSLSPNPPPLFVWRHLNHINEP